MKSEMIFLIIILVLMSCKNNQVNFELKNHSTATMYEIEIFTSSEVSYQAIDSISIQDSEIIHLDMDKEPSVDGEYRIRYLQYSEIKHHEFGYYTNGYPVSEKYILEIKDDTISIQEILNNY